jgi:peptide/nickel transport system substrate-binding protein
MREVREALDIAIDRNALFKVLFPRGDALQAVSAFPPAVPGYNQALKNEYDPERAKRLLAAAGVKGELEIDLWALPISRPTNPNGQLMAQMIQADWAKIGVKAQIVSYEWGEYLKRAAQGEHDAMLMGWTGDNGDPDNFLTPQFSCASVQSGLNFARYCDPQLDRLIAEGKAASAQAQRSELYGQAQAIIQQQALWLPLAHPTAFALHSDRVSGYQVSPFGRQDFAKVRLN